jgi:peptide/nickel transport system permease protein
MTALTALDQHVVPAAPTRRRGHVLPAISFLARRLAAMAGLLLTLSFLVFSLLYLAPGDVTRNLMGNRRVTPEAVAAVRAQFHLDESFLSQYWNWLSSALHGDFGTSIRSGTPVSAILGERFGVTISLTALAFVLAIAAGVPLGVAAALRAGGGLDRTIVGLSVVGVSAPGFAVGLVLLYVFAVMLGWFPAYGVGGSGVDRLWHLTLPAIALALGLGAMVVKITRTAVLREVSEDYVAFARSRGLRQTAVARLYLANAAIPIITSAGLLLAFLFGGTVLVETTFALPGLGQLMADSITFKDVPVVQAITLLVAAVIVAMTFLVDIAAVLVDPRLRSTGTRS